MPTQLRRGSHGEAVRDLQVRLSALGHDVGHDEAGDLGEATEAAVKLARHATGRPNVIVVQGGFHGRTYLTMAMTTSKVGVRAGYQPLPAGVFAT